MPPCSRPSSESRSLGRRLGRKRAGRGWPGSYALPNRALCVVNLKRHAFTLMDALKDDTGVFHLSTNLCPEHRRTVLDNVRKQLAMPAAACRLISTQCVEAGVDVDFPEVFRAFAPLEAIAQAAGRCNREGRLNEQGQLGRVTVFDPAEEGGWRRRYPTFAYYQAAQVTRTLLTAHGDIDINKPEVFRDVLPAAV